MPLTSHMACEVAAERAFDAAYADKNLETLGEAIDGLMNGFNLGNERRRKLYNALTGTEFEKESFWSRFKKASEKRNSIVHKGGYASKKEAVGALQSAKELITHLKQLRTRCAKPIYRSHTKLALAIIELERAIGSPVRSSKRRLITPVVRRPLGPL